MGHFDKKWNNLPNILNLHVILPFVAIGVHNLLVIPVFIQLRKHEQREVVQNPMMSPNSLTSKSLESFAINCTSMGIFALGMLNFSGILNR